VPKTTLLLCKAPQICEESSREIIKLIGGDGIEYTDLWEEKKGREFFKVSQEKAKAVSSWLGELIYLKRFDDGLTMPQNRFTSIRGVREKKQSSRKGAGAPSEEGGEDRHLRTGRERAND